MRRSKELVFGARYKGEERTEKGIATADSNMAIKTTTKTARSITMDFEMQKVESR